MPNSHSFTTHTMNLLNTSKTYYIPKRREHQTAQHEKTRLYCPYPTDSCL